MSDEYNETDRNPALAAAISRIAEYAEAEIAALETGPDGFPVDFIILAHDGENVEILSEIRDHNTMSHVLEEAISNWIDMGLASPDDRDEDPLFTATFDPQKVRPS